MFPPSHPLPSVGERHLGGSWLTSLEVGVFDKNTALTNLYVDPKQIGGDVWGILPRANAFDDMAGWGFCQIADGGEGVQE